MNEKCEEMSCNEIDQAMFNEKDVFLLENSLRVLSFALMTNNIIIMYDIVRICMRNSDFTRLGTNQSYSLKFVKSFTSLKQFEINRNV